MRTPARRTDAIAAQINALHADFISAARHTVNLGIKIGGLLSVKKESLGHGAWLPWCEANLQFGARTASNYMRLWVHRSEINQKFVSDLSGAYKLLTVQRETPNVPQRRDPDARLLVELEKRPLPERLRLAWRIVLRR